MSAPFRLQVLSGSIEFREASATGRRFSAVFDLGGPLPVGERWVRVELHSLRRPTRTLELAHEEADRPILAFATCTLAADGFIASGATFVRRAGADRLQRLYREKGLRLAALLCGEVTARGSDGRVLANARLVSMVFCNDATLRRSNKDGASARVLT